MAYKPLIITLLSGASALKVQSELDSQNINLSMPSISMPSFNPPSARVPSISMPSVSMPSFNPPSVSRPSISMPSVSMPSISMPSVNIPSISVPGISVPGIDLPRINLPRINLPSINLPSIDSSGINLPSINLPNIDSPRINLPSINPGDSGIGLPPLKLDGLEISLPKFGIDEIDGEISNIGDFFANLDAEAKNARAEFDNWFDERQEDFEVWLEGALDDIDN